MQDGAARVAGGLLLLVALWIGVYWWWPSEPPISYAAKEAAASEAAKPPNEAAEPDAPVAEPVKEPAKPTPPPASSRPPAVIVPEFTEHTVLPNETFASIAKAYYGSSSYATAISKANPFISPQTLAPGRVIRIPADPKNIQGIPVTNPVTDVQEAPRPAPKPEEPPLPEGMRIYVVQSGDTLSTISKKLYGEARLASLIFDANRDQMDHEDELKIGQKLKVPPKP